MDITIEGPLTKMASACAPVVRALPKWFVPNAAVAQHIMEDADALPTLVAWIDDQAVGFLVLQDHTQYAAEIHVMGVRTDMQHSGIGRRLVLEAERALRARGIEYLQVKTLSAAHPDVHYEGTRRFYLAMGFRPLEEFAELWGKGNPCQQMVKFLPQP